MSHAAVFSLGGGATFVPRVLEVEKGKLCFVIGTVYMDMPLKPNVLEDIARDVRITNLPSSTDLSFEYLLAFNTCTPSKAKILL